MPRNVRNFWIEAEVDGRMHGFSGGPVSKGGGFRLTVQIRNKGSVTRAGTLYGHEIDGKLTLAWQPAVSGEYIELLTTTR